MQKNFFKRVSRPGFAISRPYVRCVRFWPFFSQFSGFSVNSLYRGAFLPVFRPVRVGVSLNYPVLCTGVIFPVNSYRIRIVVLDSYIRFDREPKLNPELLLLFVFFN